MLVDLSPMPAFLLASMVVILTPGVDVFLLLRTSLNSGVRAGLLALAGIHTATAVQMALVISGLGALVTRHPSVLAALKWVGAAYLCYLAATLLRGLWLSRKRAGESPLLHGTSDGNPYVRGLLSNITNPKMLLFTLAFLPQFVGDATQPALQLVVLAAAFLVLAAIWEVAIVLGASSIAQRLRQPKIVRSMDMVSAAAFLTISVGLVTG